MFHVEETVSIFNLLYADELKTWIDANFTTSREGDIVNHTKHLVLGIFGLQNMTQEYVDIIEQSPQKNLISTGWKENPGTIHAMLAEIKKFDALRNESFEEVFPELANLYARFW